MNNREFIHELSMLEACKKLFPEDHRNRPARWRGIFTLVKDYSAETWKAACVKLLASGNEYLPSSERILRACEEVGEEAQSRQKVASPKFPLEPHKCREQQGKISPLIKMLMRDVPYEAEHLCCPGKIKATCPTCGARHEFKGVFSTWAEILNDHPEGMNDRFKGYLLCGKCPH